MQSLDHPNIIRLYGVVLTQPLKMVKPGFECQLVWRAGMFGNIYVFSGNGTGLSGFAVRHPARPSVRVPSGPPLALHDSDSVGYGLPGDQEVDPQGSGCQKHPSCFQGDGQDRGFWPHARIEPRDGSLRDVGSQKDPVCMVRAVGNLIHPGLLDKKIPPNIVFGVFQVCSREPPRGLLLPLLRCVDVWSHLVGDVHLL